MLQNINTRHIDKLVLLPQPRSYTLNDNTFIWRGEVLRQVQNTANGYSTPLNLVELIFTQCHKVADTLTKILLRLRK